MIRYNYHGLLKLLGQEFGARLGVFLANRFARKIRKVQNVEITHFRVARADDETEMKRFKEDTRIIPDRGTPVDWLETYNDKDQENPVDYWLGFTYVRKEKKPNEGN